MWTMLQQGFKSAEFRKDDRGFTVGDILLLYDGDKITNPHPIHRKISHIVRGPAFGIPEGYAMLSFYDYCKREESVIANALLAYSDGAEAADMARILETLVTLEEARKEWDALAEPDYDKSTEYGVTPEREGALIEFAIQEDERLADILANADNPSNYDGDEDWGCILQHRVLPDLKYLADAYRGRPL